MTDDDDGKASDCDSVGLGRTSNDRLVWYSHDEGKQLFAC